MARLTAGRSAAPPAAADRSDDIYEDR
jgi:hypothetical protein